MKDHFVKIAVSLLGNDKTLEIIRYICKEKRLDLRKYQKEIMSCKFEKVKDERVFDIIKEVNYDGNSEAR